MQIGVSAEFEKKNTEQANKQTKNPLFMRDNIAVLIWSLLSEPAVIPP